MVVTLQESCQGVTSLRIGARNAKRYFSRNMPTLDLDLECVQIQCALGQDFWKDHPEILDPRLCAWLTAKNSKWKASGSRLVLLMVPAGPNSFRLLPKEFSSSAKSRNSYHPAA